MNGEGEEAGGRNGRAGRPKRGGTKGYAPYGAIPTGYGKEPVGARGEVSRLGRDDHLQGSVVQADSERRPQLEGLTIDVHGAGLAPLDTDLSRLLGAVVLVSPEAPTHQIPEYDGSLYRTEGADEDEVEEAVTKVCLGSDVGIVAILRSIGYDEDKGFGL